MGRGGGVLARMEGAGILEGGGGGGGLGGWVGGGSRNFSLTPDWGGGGVRQRPYIRETMHSAQNL